MYVRNYVFVRWTLNVCGMNRIPHTHSVCTCPWTEHRWFHEFDAPPYLLAVSVLKKTCIGRTNDNDGCWYKLTIAYMRSVLYISLWIHCGGCVCVCVCVWDVLLFRVLCLLWGAKNKNSGILVEFSLNAFEEGWWEDACDGILEVCVDSTRRIKTNDL